MALRTADNPWLEAGMISPKQIPKYLCSLATGDEDNRKEQIDLKLDMCRQCESQCAFGRAALKQEKATRVTARIAPKRGH